MNPQVVDISQPESCQLVVRACVETHALTCSATPPELHTAFVPAVWMTRGAKTTVELGAWLPEQV